MRSITTESRAANGVGEQQQEEQTGTTSWSTNSTMPPPLAEVDVARYAATMTRPRVGNKKEMTPRTIRRLAGS